MGLTFLLWVSCFALAEGPVDDRGAQCAQLVRVLQELIVERIHSERNLPDLFADDTEWVGLSPGSAQLVWSHGSLEVERLAVGESFQGVDGWRNLVRHLEFLARVQSLEVTLFEVRGTAQDYAAQLRLAVLGASSQQPALVEILLTLQVQAEVVQRVELHSWYQASWSGGRFHDVTDSALDPEGEAFAQLAASRAEKLQRTDRRNLAGVGVGPVVRHDLDHDGRMELFCCEPGGYRNLLLWNRGEGAFQDESAASGLDRIEPTSAAWFGDLDGDDTVDAVLGGEQLRFFSGGPQALQFLPAANAFADSPASGPRLYTDLKAADMDGDGDLDLLICAHQATPAEILWLQPYPVVEPRNGPRNLLLKNVSSNGNLRFQDVTAAAGLERGNDRLTSHAAFQDLDGDGQVDVYFATDFGLDQLFLGRPEGLFEQVLAVSDREVLGRSRWLGVADFDQDGVEELLVASASNSLVHRSWSLDPALPLAPRRRADLQALHRGSLLLGREESGFRHLPVNGLLHRGEVLGGGLVSLLGESTLRQNVDRSAQVLLLCGAEQSGLMRSVVADLLPQVAPEDLSENRSRQHWRAWRRRVQPSSFEAPADPVSARLLVRLTDGEFVDVAPLLGLSNLGPARAFASLDLEGDGDLDLVVRGSERPSLRILRNDLLDPRRTREPRSPGEPADAEWLRLQEPVPAPLLEATLLGGGSLLLGGRLGRPALVRVSAQPQSEELTSDPEVDLAWLDLSTADAEGIQSLQVLLDELMMAALPLAEGTTLAFAQSGWLEAIYQGPVAFPLLAANSLAVKEPGRRRFAGLVQALREAGLPKRAVRLALMVEAAGIRLESSFRLQAGLALAAAGRPQEALERLSGIAPTNPGFVDALRAMGRIQRLGGQYGLAEKLLQRLLQSRPGDELARLERGLLRLQTGRAIDALDDLRAAAFLDPSNFEAEMAFGQALLQAGYLELSIAALQRAQQLRPRRPEPLLQEAVVHLTWGKHFQAQQPEGSGAAAAEQEFERAADCLRAALQRDPESARVHFELGSLYLQQGQLDQALEHALHAARQDPQKPAIQQLVKNIRAQQGE